MHNFLYAKKCVSLGLVSNQITYQMCNKMMVQHCLHKEVCLP